MVELVEPDAAEAVGDAEPVGLLGGAARGRLEWPAAPGAEGARVHRREQLRERVVEDRRRGRSQLAAADGAGGVLAPGLGGGSGRERLAQALAFARAPDARAVRRVAVAAAVARSDWHDSSWRTSMPSSAITHLAPRRCAPASAPARATAISFLRPRRTTRTSGATYSAQKSHETPNAAHASSTFKANRTPRRLRSRRLSSRLRTRPGTTPLCAAPAAPLHPRTARSGAARPVHHHRSWGGGSDHTHTPRLFLTVGVCGLIPHPPRQPIHRARIRAAPERVVERVNERHGRTRNAPLPRDTHGTLPTGFGRIQPDPTGRKPRC